MIASDSIERKDTNGPTTENGQTPQSINNNINITGSGSLPCEKAKNIGTTDKSVKYTGPPTAAAPFLPPAAPDVMTLILDMDHTMLLCQPAGKIKNPNFVMQNKADKTNAVFHVKIRSGLDSFLKKASESFEIVLFTAAQAGYSNMLIDRIDTNKLIAHRLSKKNCTIVEGKAVKDLSLIGRPLDSMVIIDDKPYSYNLHPNNGIPIPPIRGDCDDNALEVIMDILNRIASEKSVDKVLGPHNQQYVRDQLSKIQYNAIENNVNHKNKSTTDANPCTSNLTASSRKRLNSSTGDCHDTPSKIANRAEQSESSKDSVKRNLFKSGPE